MSGLQVDYDKQQLTITLDRPQCRNAFDDTLLLALTKVFTQLDQYHDLRCVMIRANGKHFCAGADLNWMQRMAEFSEAENVADSLILANALQSIYQCPVPTICLIQGAAMGGGAGLVAACDIAIASEEATFCFSEAKLGLIPAVISPYVIEAIGARRAKALFCTAEVFPANLAQSHGLINQVVPTDGLLQAGADVCQQIKGNAPLAVRDCKQLVNQINHQPIDSALLEQTAQLIASKRVSPEGQAGIQAFLTKSPINWSKP